MRVAVGVPDRYTMTGRVIWDTARSIIETVTLRRLFGFFGVEHATCQVRILAVHRAPDGGWVARQGSDVAMDLEDAGRRVRFLVRDRDA